MQLVKNKRLLLPLTEVMKIIRLTSPLLIMLRLSSPRPRLRHGRQLALLFHLTLNLCTLLCSVTGSSSSSSNFPNSSSSRESALIYVAYLRSHFSVSQPKTLCSRPRGYLSELRRATCPESHSSFCSLFTLAEFHVAASNLSSCTTTGPHKVAYPISTFLTLAWIFFFTSSISLGLCIHFLPSGRHLLLFLSIRWECLSTLLFLPAYLSHLLHIKAV